MASSRGKESIAVDWGTFASLPVTFREAIPRIPLLGIESGSRYSVRGLHCTTPISPTRCHYWSAAAYDHGHQVSNLEQDFTAILETVVKQDADVLEAIR